MSKPLLLADWTNWQPTAEQPTIKHTIAATFEVPLDVVKPYEVLIAYEEQGGYEGSCFYLLRKRGAYYEVHGGHCSCYGFEGQWEPKEAPLEYLKSQKFYVYAGGHELAIKARIAKLRAPKKVA